MFKTRHHPDLNLLAEYASGSLDWALSLGVATHVHFCPECREKIMLLNRVGGDLLLGTDSAAVDSRVFDRIMGKIDELNESGNSDGAIDKGTADNSGIVPCSGAAAADSCVDSIQAEQPNLVKDLSSATALLATAESSAERAKVAQTGEDRLLAQVKLPKIVRKLLPQGKPLAWKKVSPALRMARLESGQSKYEVAFHQINAGGKVVEHGHTGLEVTIVLKGSFSDADGIYNEGDFIVRQPGDVHRPTAAQDQDCLCISIAEAPVKLTGLLGKLVNPFISFRPA